MALTWAAPRIARQARSPPAIPMTTRTTSNTPSTPSRRAPPGEITSLCSQVSQLLPHRGLTPTGGSGPATQRLHIAPQLPNGANPSQPRSRPPRVILGPLLADSSFFLNVYLTFWEKNNGWYEWFFQKVYLDDLKKPLRQKGVLTSVRKYPRHSKSSKNFFNIVISSVGWLLIFHCLNACSTLTYQYTITHAQRRWHCRRYGGCGQDGQ